MTTVLAPSGPPRAEALPAPTIAAPAIGPVSGAERIEAIDILRGIAILGILVVNMGLFSLPEVPMRELWPNALDGTVDRLTLFLAQEKFKTLFSFLFGLGLVVQMMRAEARGGRFLPLYARRLGILFLLGILHFLFLWDGDILHDYALIACVVLLFRQRALNTLLASAAAFLSVAVLFYGLMTYYAVTREAPPAVTAWISYETGVDDPATATTEISTEELDEYDRVVAHGTYAELVALRARELPRDLSPDTDDAYVIALFLLGVYAGRRRLFQDPAAHRPFLRRVQRWGALVGIVANAAFAAGGSYDPAPTSVPENLGRLCLLVGAPALTLSFAATIILLAEDEVWRRRLAPLAAVGRTALSNYLLQSVICTTLFYGYGLGLFGKVRPSLGLLLTLGIFLVQVPLSAWWLRRFRFGPVEWLWRSATYWRLQPMRLAGAVPTPAVAGH